MRVYLDNNVLISIEENKYSLNDFISIPESEYYYSNAHISELLNGVDKSIPGLKERRLSTIISVCGSKYLFQDTDSSIQLTYCNPEKVYDSLSMVSVMRVGINNFAISFTPNRAGILTELQWDAKEVGNYSPKEIFKEIDKRLRTSKYKLSIEDYLNLCEAYTESTVYNSLFNLLDMVSYRKDKNNISRLYDSSHTYYAQKCDVLVSDDARMRVKAEAVYHYLKVHTQVMSAEDFLGLYR